MKCKKETDAFWFPALENPPPPNFSPGLIPVLKSALVDSHSKGRTRRAVLCYERTVHVAKEGWDRKWGCGYRCFEMACAALMDQPFQPLYFPHLDFPSPPCVRNLQLWIEEAWEKGFDPDGRKELQKLVDSSKQIGTSDLWVAFSSRGIPAELVEFNLKNSPEGTKIVTDWIAEYFSSPRERNNSTVDDALRGASPVTCTDRMPIILQYSGHSQVIVGYEISKSGSVNLLKFNSSDLPNTKLRQLGLERLSQAQQETPSRSLQSPSRPGLRDRLYETPKNDKKRGARDSSQEMPKNATKRARAERIDDDDDDDEIIIIGESRGVDKSLQKVKNKDRPFDATEVLRFFRLDLKSMRRNQYQILYFPMEEPLTEEQRLSRLEVTSTEVC